MSLVKSSITQAQFKDLVKNGKVIKVGFANLPSSKMINLKQDGSWQSLGTKESYILKLVDNWSNNPEKLRNLLNKAIKENNRPQLSNLVGSKLYSYTYDDKKIVFVDFYPKSATSTIGVYLI
jgi:hypothetical protein